VKPAKPASPGSNGASGGVVKATIPSDYNAGRDVQERILEDVQRHGFSTDDTFAIRIALEEALVNAIKHGNRQDPGKMIRVEARVTKKRAEITIEDEGPGFKRSGIPDPTLEENLHKCSGRGILLIESYMDGVYWSRGGRRLKMVKENG
jgi:serine/threonine-protein kinase RsbW